MNLISLGTLQANGYSFRLDGDRDIMRISNGAMKVMVARRTTCNIYKLLGGTIMGDIEYIEIDNDATKL